MRAYIGGFEGRDVEHNKPTDKVADLLLFERAQITMDTMITAMTEKVMEVTEALQ